MIRDLHTAGDPVSQTGGTINRVKPSIKRDGFGQAISSLKFVAQIGSGLPGKLPRIEGISVRTVSGRGVSHFVRSLLD